MEKGKTNYITKETIIACSIGLVIGIVLMLIIGVIMKATGIAKLRYGADTIATVNGKAIKTETIYEKTKLTGGLNILVNEVDKAILNEKYELTEKEKKDAENKAKSYIDYYEAMGYSEEEFLKAYGFSNYEEFVADVELNEKSNKYLYDYLEAKLEAGAVQKYYDENKDNLESYDSEHILVRITDDVTEEQALALANEIIEKLNGGKTFEEIVEEYGDKIVHENLGYQSKTASLEQTYLDELVALQDGEYSKTPIKTSYGYHIVHKLSTATYEDLRGTIIETLAADILDEDENIKYKAFIELRDEKGLKIYDEELNKQYEDYRKRLYETTDNQDESEEQ